MTIFNLPDLGEGLPEAEIHEWYVSEGSEVEVDQPLVSVETAKAIVDVPSPYKAIVKKLYGQPGDIIKTGAPLIAFQSDSDSGTVVGNIHSSDDILEEEFIIGSANTKKTSIRATPAVRALAKQLNINLSNIQPSNANGIISLEDVQQYHKPLQGVRRSMANVMQLSHQQVVPVSLFDDADVHHWTQDTDITVTIIKALIDACRQEPALNAWFDGQHLTKQLHEEINLGLAIDTDDGLFVPVIHNVNVLSEQDIRNKINQLKHQVKERSLKPEAFKDATISLSNFGNFAGKYASPIIVPPMVAIIAIGKLRESVLAYQGQPVIHNTLPLSLSFDHRALTGGEASRFLGYFIQALEKTAD